LRDQITLLRFSSACIFSSACLSGLLPFQCAYFSDRCCAVYAAWLDGGESHRTPAGQGKGVADTSAGGRGYASVQRRGLREGGDVKEGRGGGVADVRGKTPTGRISALFQLCFVSAPLFQVCLYVSGLLCFRSACMFQASSVAGLLVGFRSAYMLQVCLSFRSASLSVCLLFS